MKLAESAEHVRRPIPAALYKIAVSQALTSTSIRFCITSYLQIHGCSVLVNRI
ncbi:MAG: hypothetical protein OXG05_06805 [Gammaproteobacteria bacterium]|nr:hypothetical protein [Gammaproteobacteria bacterium]